MQGVGPLRWGGQEANFEKRWGGMREDPMGSLGVESRAGRVSRWRAKGLRGVCSPRKPRLERMKEGLGSKG